MKTAIATVLFLISSIVHADSIRCYVGDKMIYHRNVKDVTYTGEVYIFTEKNSGRIVLTDASCVVKIDL